MHTMTRWHRICRLDQLLPERGAAALIRRPGAPDVRLAVFRAHDGRLFAIEDVDPFTGAAVLSRGIMGSRGASPTVASPMHKQVFALETGRCLDDSEVSVAVFEVRLSEDAVEVRVA